MKKASVSNSLDLQDESYLKETFLLADKAKGFTSPNPLVGAVLVKDNKIIARGFHKKAGCAHAEIDAFKQARGSVKGSTLYVNLEPCCHYGKTPPCVDEVIARGVARVVVATTDPNPKVNGASLARLRKAGIEVRVGILRNEACRLNEIFFTHITKRRPFVCVKVAQSLDGKIATSMGQSKWITSIASRLCGKGLRDEYDCVLVGSNTVLADDPELNGLKKVPYKVVIDPDLRMPLISKLARQCPEKLIVFIAQGVAIKKRYCTSGMRVVALAKRHGIFDVRQILAHLYDLGLMSVFVEGGSYTLGEFLRQRCIDKLHLFMAPLLLGGASALTSFGSRGFPGIDDAARLKDAALAYSGKDIHITAYLDYEE